MPALRAMRHRDFRWLWLGAFFSFTGSQIQNVAQQDLIIKSTGSPFMLSMVSFSIMLPVSLFGPFLGVVADMYDKRKVLIACMLVSAIGPIVLGTTMSVKSHAYWMFLLVGFVAGFVQCVEVPTRQSVVRAVVDESDLAAAIPAQASTFNLAKILGPAVAGPLVLRFGPASCFWLNGISFFALAFAAFVIKADLRPVERRVEPVRDLVAEGFLYTLRSPDLRTLFLMESATSVFGAFYLAQMSAIVYQQLKSNEAGLATAFAIGGVGALLGLFTTASLSAKPFKPTLIRVSMSVMAVSTFLLGLTRSTLPAFALLLVMGVCMIMQFNTTNTLFQLIAPPALRGRVISMHMWAISGVAPLGVLLFGQVSEVWGTHVSLMTGGACLVAVAAWGWRASRNIKEPVFGAA